jgi:hypothetical protein
MRMLHVHAACFSRILAEVVAKVRGILAEILAKDIGSACKS